MIERFRSRALRPPALLAFTIAAGAALGCSAHAAGPDTEATH
jgi:hypothetical protein